MNAHFCFSELLILREKNDSRIFFWAIGFSKNIEKTPYRRVAQKRYNFAPGATNHIFFRLTLYNKKLFIRVMEEKLLIII